MAHATKNNPAGALRQVQRGANRLSNSFNDRLFRDLFQAIFTAATARLRKFGQENGLWRFCGLHLRWTLTPDSCDGARDRRADWQRRRRVAKRRALRRVTLHLREHRARRASIQAFTITHSTTPVKAGTERIVGRSGLRCVTGPSTWWTAKRTFGIGLARTKITISLRGASRIATLAVADRR